MYFSVVDGFCCFEVLVFYDDWVGGGAVLVVEVVDGFAVDGVVFVDVGLCSCAGEVDAVLGVVGDGVSFELVVVVEVVDVDAVVGVVCDGVVGECVLVVVVAAVGTGVFEVDAFVGVFGDGVVGDVVVFVGVAEVESYGVFCDVVVLDGVVCVGSSEVYSLGVVPNGIIRDDALLCLLEVYALVVVGGCGVCDGDAFGLE